MKIRYDVEADILLLRFRDAPPVDAIEESGGIIVSYGEDGESISIELLNAATRQMVIPGEASVPIQEVNAR